MSTKEKELEQAAERFADRWRRGWFSKRERILYVAELVVLVKNYGKRNSEGKTK